METKPHAVVIRPNFKHPLFLPPQPGHVPLIKVGDDYVTEPFKFDEVHAPIRAQLRIIELEKNQ